MYRCKDGWWRSMLKVQKKKQKFGGFGGLRQVCAKRRSAVSGQTTHPFGHLAFAFACLAWAWTHERSAHGGASKTKLERWRKRMISRLSLIGSTPAGKLSHRRNLMVQGISTTHSASRRRMTMHASFFSELITKSLLAQLRLWQTSKE